MRLSDPFPEISLLGIYGLSIAVVLLALGIGFVLGRRKKYTKGGAKEASIGSAVAATLGLLAFMLAFTFNMTAERFSERKALLLEEVNAIATTYLRADFLSKTGERQARSLLAEYAQLRDFNPGDIDEEDYSRRLQRSEEIHQEIWRLVAEHADGGFDSVKLRAFYEPLNEVIDFHTRRVLVGGSYRIPVPIWVALYSITALAMFGIGFQLGASRSGSLPVAIALSIAFSLVILLIADLDRSGQGLLLVDQAPMHELSTMLQAAEREAVTPDGVPPD